MDDGADDEGNMMACLNRCDAKTLHQLKWPFQRAGSNVRDVRCLIGCAPARVVPDPNASKTSRS